MPASPATETRCRHPYAIDWTILLLDNLEFVWGPRIRLSR
ncbi:hypothetical protein SUDANB140_07534 (plasmid) [Streptomyces sp. enrichment culture]